ncbi:MAG: hypothetical protein R2684_07125 [Pyrinomonadaceae bacterium]
MPEPSVKNPEAAPSTATVVSPSPSPPIVPITISRAVTSTGSGAGSGSGSGESKKIEIFKAPPNEELTEIKIPNLGISISLAGETEREFFYLDAARVERWTSVCGPLETRIEVYDYPDKLNFDSDSAAAGKLLDSWVKRDRYDEKFETSTSTINGTTFYTFRSREIGRAEYINATIIGSSIIWISSKLTVGFLERDWNDEIENRFVAENKRLLNSFKPPRPTSDTKQLVDLESDGSGAASRPRFLKHTRDSYNEESGVFVSPDAGLSIWFPKAPSRAHRQVIENHLGFDSYRFGYIYDDSSSLTAYVHEYPMPVNNEWGPVVMESLSRRAIEELGLKNAEIRKVDCDAAHCLEAQGDADDQKFHSFVRIEGNRIFDLRIHARKPKTPNSLSLFDQFESNRKKFFESFSTLDVAPPVIASALMPIERDVKITLESLVIEFETSGLLFDIPIGYKAVSSDVNDRFRNNLIKQFISEGESYAIANMSASAFFLHFVVVETNTEEPSFLQLITTQVVHPNMSLRDLTEINKKTLLSQSALVLGNGETIHIAGIEFLSFDAIIPGINGKMRFFIGKKDGIALNFLCRFKDSESELNIMNTLKSMRTLPLSLRNRTISALPQTPTITSNSKNPAFFLQK